MSIIAATAMMLALSACSSGDGVNGEALKSAEMAASRMAGQVESSPFASLPSSEDSTPAGDTGDMSAQSSRDAGEESLPAIPTPGDSESAAGSWWDFPWDAPDGYGCDPPAESPGAALAIADPSVVLVVGDSLIRDSRDQIAAELSDRGFSPVFLCWGGKNLEWGKRQIEMANDLGLVPDCLVVNLGTNDFKGTSAMQLEDAVGLDEVARRLESLLLSVSDVNSVMVVDIAGNPAYVPSTMRDLGLAPQVWLDAVATTGVGTVVSWSDQVQANINLVNQGSNDGVHDTPEGQVVRAGLIGQAVATYCG